MLIFNLTYGVEYLKADHTYILLGPYITCFLMLTIIIPIETVQAVSKPKYNHLTPNQTK